MAEPTLEERIATLEAQMKDLANDHGKQLYSDVTHVEWGDEQGWLLMYEPPIASVRLR